MAAEAVAEKVTGRARVAATRTFHGATSATDARNQKVSVFCLQYTNRKDWTEGRQAITYTSHILPMRICVSACHLTSNVVHL